eukprot:GFUD01006519.1.p1 GENE.GFUD01006519.1~~GFUD01006519.1.p1  ORF type:complete len:801 (+),score=164.53 GFUD01006519.1:39-2441(+)
MSMIEKHKQVLEIIKSGASLKDDTYVSQFLETTGSVLHNVEDVEKFGLLDLIIRELAESRSGCCFGGEMDSKDAEVQNVVWNFIIDLSTTVVKSVSDLSYELLRVVGICSIDSHVSSNYIPILQFYTQVFLCKSNVLDIARFLCEENCFWEQFLQSVIIKKANKYVNKAVVDCISEYVKFSLEASKLNQRPKGCEIKVLLESNLKILVSLGHKTGCNQVGSRCDVFEILNQIIDNLDEKNLDSFLFPLVKELINFDKIMKTETSVPSTVLRCYIKTYLTDPNFHNIKTYLKFIFTNSKCSIDSKKRVIVNVSNFQELSEVFKFILDKFCEDSTEPMFSLCRYFFSFHTVESMVKRCEDVEIAHKVFALIVKHLKQYSDDLCDSTCNQNFIRNVFLFGGCFFKLHDLNLFDMYSVIDPILTISNHKYEVDDFVRSDALGLLRVILSKIENVENLNILAKTLCGFACDPGSLNVVRDSALMCLSSLLLNKFLALKLSEKEIELVSCVILKANSGKDKLVKGAAVIIQTSMFEHLVDKVSCNQVAKFFPSEEVNDLEICDIYADEERKEMMKLASKVHMKLEDPVLLDLAKSFVLTSLDVDTNWDVKVHSVQFWKAVYIKACESSHGDPVKLIKHLEKHYFFTGLVLGCHDYEESVKTCYFKFIKEMDFGHLKGRIGEESHNLKRKVEEVSFLNMSRVKKRMVLTNEVEDDISREEEIEDLLEENDPSLVNSLTERSKSKEKFSLNEKKKSYPCCSLNDFLLFQLELLNPEIAISQEASLESVLDDIIQSSSDESLIDLVDCY